MKYRFTGLLIILALQSFSQNSDINILSKEKALGKYTINNKEIMGIEYTFPERIHETYLDTISGYLTIQTRGISKNGKWVDNKGKILLYDLNNNKLKWSRAIQYQLNSLEQFSNTMILSGNINSFCLDVSNGKNLWEVKNKIYFVEALNNIGIGYKVKNFNNNTNVLEGIDLSNGNVLWTKELNREYGWDGVFYLDSTTLIVVAGGIHSFDIRTGAGWDYNTRTGKRNASIYGSSVIRSISSNVLIDSNDFYFSSSEYLVKINSEDGEIFWKYPFPKNMSSSSTLFQMDSLVYMVNYGYAFMGYRQLDHGSPFIACFDKETGKQQFFSLVMVKNDPILSGSILNENIYISFKNRMAIYSLTDGRLLEEKTIIKKKQGELKYILNERAYISTSYGHYQSIYTLDSNMVYASTDNNEILIIDEQLQQIGTIEHEDIYMLYLIKDNYQFISNGEQTMILNSEGYKIAEITASPKARLINNILYDRQEETFLAIDLGELFK